MLRSLLVITWDGKEIPFAAVHADVKPEFDILLFNYSGNGKIPNYSTLVPNYLVSHSTENKGQVFEQICYFLEQENITSYEYVGVYDDDLIFKISDINYMLHLAQFHKLDVFHASVSHDSYFSHRRFLHKSSLFLEEVEWVEIMAPFYREEIFKKCLPYFKKAISAHGIDYFLVPVLQRILKKTNTALIHAVMIKHSRPVKSHQRIYSNNKTSDEETELIRQEAISLAQKYPELFDENFYRKILKVGNEHLLEAEDKLIKVKKLIMGFWTKAKNEAN